MALIDALRGGVDLANAMNQGVMTSAQARYAYPLTAAQLEQMKLANAYQTIINQYQPDKSRLGNEALGLANTYQGILNKYAPDKMSLENQQAAENLKFTPLKYAIDAQNSMNTSSRFGGAYQYLKSVADLPAEQKSAWLANPDNYSQYLQMIDQLHSSSASGGRPQVITPELLKKVGLGSISGDIMDNKPDDTQAVSTVPVTNVPVSNPSVGGISAPIVTNNTGASIPTPSGITLNVNPQQPNVAAPYTPVNPPVSVGGMAVPMQPNLPMGAPQGAAIAPSMAPAQPAAAPVGGMATPMVPRAPMGNTPAPAMLPTTQKEISDIDSTPSDQLTPAQRQYLSFAAANNAKVAGRPATTRAIGAVTLEKFIQDNASVFAPRLKNAAEYAGALGKGKEYAEKLAGKNPQSLQDYTWVQNDFIPQLANNIRIMEKLSITPQQQEQVNDMTKAAFNWYQNPQTAIKYINMNFDMFRREGQAALDAAQPVKKGVLEKMYGLSPVDGTSSDYFANDKSKELSGLSDAELMKRLQGGK